MDLALTVRDGAPVRCALCHVLLGATRHRCPGCATLLHVDCLAAAGACPTLGCPTLPHPAGPRDLAPDLADAPSPWDAPRAARWAPWAGVAAGLVAAVTLGLLGATAGEAVSGAPSDAAAALEAAASSHARGALDAELTAFARARGRAPRDAAELERWFAGWSTLPRDLHGAPYRLVGAGPVAGLVSFGRDGRPGGTGADADVSAWATLEPARAPSAPGPALAAPAPDARVDDRPSLPPG